MTSAARFALLFAAQFAAIGVMLPFLPPLLRAGGLGAAEVATVLAAAAAVRLVAGPAGGALADRLGDARRFMAGCAALAALIACGFGLAGGFVALLLLAMLLAVAMAPVIPLGDAMALAASRRGAGFDYPRVRAAGSAAFVAASAGAGWATGLLGPQAAAWLLGAALAATALAGMALPPTGLAPRRRGGGFAALLALPDFRRLVLVAALIQASHAMYYGFGAIAWSDAGLAPAVIGLLFAEGVVAEVALFLAGQRLGDRLGAAGLALLAACAGALRWAILAHTAWLPALIFAQLGHAATFGALHLAGMRVLARIVPARHAGSAQTLYAALGSGLPVMVATLACGPLYARFGAQAYLAMAALAALALPFALTLRRSGA